MQNNPKKHDNAPLIGTAGWIFPEWKGTFYPPHEKNLLQYYSKIFNFVEINTTFYSIPEPLKINAWLAQTPDYFVFSAKMTNQLTHQFILFPEKEQEKTMTSFLNSLTRFNQKIGAILLQFPPSFNHTKENIDYIEHLLTKIEETLDIKIIVPIEFRSFDWHGNHDIQQLLESHPEVCIVQSDRFSDRKADIISKVSYIRLIGDRIQIKDTDLGKKKINRNQDLRNWAKYVSEIHKTKEKIFVVIGNHFSGHAAIDALYMAKFLEELKIRTNINFPPVFPPPTYEQKSLEEF